MSIVRQDILELKKKIDRRRIVNIIETHSTRLMWVDENLKIHISRETHDWFYRYEWFQDEILSREIEIVPREKLIIMANQDLEGAGGVDKWRKV